MRTRCARDAHEVRTRCARRSRCRPPSPRPGTSHVWQVGVLLNHLLAVFNELRQCVPYELRAALLDRMTAVLLGCVHSLRDLV